MSTVHVHSRLLIQAGREILRPLGLVQKGRSRTWLDDNDWWLGVVEFQPSNWSRGSYLNVGAMLLWRHADDPFLYFAVGGRVDGFIEFESEEQFAPEAKRFALLAAEEAKRFRSRLPDFAGAAAYLEANLDGDPDLAFDAAVAWGLADDADRAHSLFDLHDSLSRRYDERDRDADWYTAELQERHESELARSKAFRSLLDQPDEFRHAVHDEIERLRRGLGLPPLTVSAPQNRG
jgi:hypothetical protein